MLDKSSTWLSLRWNQLSLRWNQLKPLRPWIWGCTAVLAILTLVWIVPQYQARLIDDDTERVAAETASRNSLLHVIQTIGGLGFVLTVYLAWQNLKLTEDKSVSDRFSKSVEMLADKRLAVRIGGIYALERIAHDSVKDHSVVMEVLAAFIRSEAYSASQEMCGVGLRQDIQNALLVLARRDTGKNEQQIDLSGAYLRRAKLSGENSDLSGVIFEGADLREVNFSQVSLNKCNFNKANLSNAELVAYKLNDCIFIKAILNEASFRDSEIKETTLITENGHSVSFYKTDLREASLSGDFKSASFRQTDLRGATLYGAILQDANFSESHLEGTRFRGFKHPLNAKYLKDILGLKKLPSPELHFSSADLTRANLYNVTFDSETEWPSDLSSACIRNMPDALTEQIKRSEQEN